MTVLVLAMTWARDYRRPDRFHLRETCDGSLRTIDTDSGLVGVAVCGLWLDGTIVDNPNTGQRCTACRAVADQLGRACLIPRQDPCRGLSDIVKSDIARWLVLRRAEQDRLMLDCRGGMCFDHGRLLPRHLRPTVSLLLDELLVDVVERTYADGTSLRVVLTDAGARRLAELTEQRAVISPRPAPALPAAVPDNT